MSIKRLCVSLLAGCVMLSLVAGCGLMKTALQPTCPYMAQAKVAKDKVKAALVSAQVGYDLVVGFAGIAPLMPSGADILAKVQVIDAALETLGKLYYDKVCLTEQDVEQAYYASLAAVVAQEQLGIHNP